MSVTEEHLYFDEKLIDIIKENNEMGNIEIFYYIIKNKNLHKLFDNAGNTLLHFASKYHNVQLIQDLIDAGAEVNIQNFEGKTPIILALENKQDTRMTESQLESVEILCEAKADIHLIDKYGKSAANLVFDDKKFTCIPIMKLFFYIMEQECMNNDELIAKKLISLGCSLQQAMFSKNVEVIEYMIREGCPVDGSHSCDGQTALHLAVTVMDLKMVEVLVKYNADVTKRDAIGYTPLAYYAVLFRPPQSQCPEIVRLLLNKIFELNIDNKERFLIEETRMILQFGNNEAIQILLKYFNNTLFIGNNDSQSPLHLLALNRTLNSVWHNNPDIFEGLFQSQKYDVNVRNSRGYTPIHYAVITYGSHVNTFKVLLENGADVNARGRDEYVPLFLLCDNKIILENKYHRIIQLLIQYGLDIQLCGPNEMTVFDIIIENKLFYKAKPLLAHLAILEEQGDHLEEHTRFKINSHSMLKDYFGFCKHKLKKMKHNSINRRLTLYSFLVEQDEKILKSCKLEHKALLKLKKLTKRRSSYYYNIVQKNISRIVKKLEFRIKSRPIICHLLKIVDDPNHVVVTEIINYLNGEDIKNLCNFDM